MYPIGGNKMNGHILQALLKVTIPKPSIGGYLVVNPYSVEEHTPAWPIFAWLLIAAQMEILPAGLIADEI